MQRRSIAHRLISVFVLVGMLLGPIAPLAHGQEGNNVYLPQVTTSSLGSRTVSLPAQTDSFGEDLSSIAYSDPEVGLSFKYPAKWYLVTDPAFRKPVPVEGVLERRLALASYADPLSGRDIPADACRMDVFVSTTSLGSLHPVADEFSDRLRSSGSVVLDNGLRGYRLAYDLSLFRQYGYEEILLPFSEGTFDFVAS